MLSILCSSFATISPPLIISPVMSSFPGLLLFFRMFIAHITSSSNISSYLSSPIGVISFNSAITSSAVFSSNCSLYSSLQCVVHLCTMSFLFMSVLPSSFLIAVSFGFHFLLTFLISLTISLVLPSPWYLSMSSNHLALSFLAAFRTFSLFVLYVLSPSSQMSLIFFSSLFSSTSLMVFCVIHFFLIFSCSGIVCSTASSMALISCLIPSSMLHVSSCVSSLSFIP